MRPYRPAAWGCPDTTSPGEVALQAVLARSFSRHRAEVCPEARTHRAISAFPAFRRSLVSPKAAVLQSQHRPTSLRTPRRSRRRRFRLESDGTEYSHKEVRVDSPLAPDYYLSDQSRRGILFDADLGSLCLPIHRVSPWRRAVAGVRSQGLQLQGGTAGRAVVLRGAVDGAYGERQRLLPSCQGEARRRRRRLHETPTEAILGSAPRPYPAGVVDRHRKQPEQHRAGS